ncbi:MAG: DUF4234 domain-containing protein [Euryarchaeota archaeon]|nr:DUF4234 domain-containing protein [Euryarchaeota archaeon]
MVLPTKVGKQRGFGRGLLFTILSLGLYSIYWNYKAHNEIFEQFELKKEGRDENIILLIFGLVVFPVLWFYQLKAIENLNYARERLGLPKAITGVEFLLWTTVGILLLLLGPLVGYAKLQKSVNEVWDRYDQRKAELVTQGQTPAAPAPLM